MRPTLQDLEDHYDEVDITDVIKGKTYYLVRSGVVNPVRYVEGRNDVRNPRIGNLYFHQLNRLDCAMSGVMVGSLSIRRSVYVSQGYRLFSSERRPVVVAVRSRRVTRMELEEE